VNPLFFDRDPTYFRLILNYVRSGKLIIPTDDSLKREIQEEAHFYGLRALKNELRDKIPVPYKEGGYGQGALFWIGTCAGTRDWKNPFEDGLVGVSSSQPLCGDASNCVARRQLIGGIAIKDAYDEWVSIDLKSFSVKPTHYSLCHGGNEFMKNWNLEASVDGVDWTICKEHIEDEGLHPHGVYTWPISAQYEFYRYFRLRSTAHESLHFSSFEIYGTIVETM